jgi:hypothetical protein
VTTSWSNVRFDHASVNGSCSTCHNGRVATGKTANHIPSANSCDDCHVTSSSINVPYDHDSQNRYC